MGTLFAEVVQAWRALLRRPAWLALAASTLALGIGATTAVFSLLDREVLGPLPYPQPDRLVVLGIEYTEGYVAAAPGFRTALAGLQSLESMGLASAFPRDANVAVGDAAEVVSMLLFDRGVVPTLGLPMAAGRNFNAEEDSPDGPQAVILSHGFWTQHFGGDPSVVGTSLQVEGRAVPVVGVLPADFQWQTGFDLVMPMRVSATSTSMATNEMLIARLAPGATIVGVSAAAGPLLRSAYTSQPGVDPADFAWLDNVTLGALALADLAHPSDILWLFFVAAGCVLVIAAVNLANLMLLRALARRHDAAVRVALGAPRGRVALPAIAEGLLVGACGAIAGLVLAWAGLRVLVAVVPAEWFSTGAVGLTPRSALLALLAGVAVAMVSGLLGIWRGTSKAPARELVSGGRSRWSRSAGRLGRSLVVAQVAMASLLLVCAGLFAHSLQRLLTVPMGFDVQDVVSFTLSPLQDRYPDIASTMGQTTRILAELERLPGVERATVANTLPTAGQFNMGVEFPDGRTVAVQYRLTGLAYNDVLAMPLLAGRALSATDDAGGEPVAVVNAEFARAYLDDQPLGRTVRLALDGEPSLRIVGVVADTRQLGPGNPPPPILYVPLAQASDGVWGMIRQYVPLHYILRTRPGTGIDEPAIREAVAAASPMQPIAALETMQAVVARTTALQKLLLMLVGLFAGLALLLAAVGLYAVTSVAVQARRHEFGVRTALGAPPVRLFRQVLLEGLRQVGLGLAIGVGLGMAVSRLLQKLLYDIGVADPVAIGGVIVVLGAAGLLASAGPAMRAARVPAMSALRQE